MFTNQILYFGMSILISLPCIMILVFVLCYICGHTTGAIIQILFKPSEQTNTGTEDKQKLMNYNSDVEENSEYGTLSSVNDLKRKSLSNESDLSIKSNEDLKANFEQSNFNTSRELLPKFDRSNESLSNLDQTGNPNDSVKDANRKDRLRSSERLHTLSERSASSKITLPELPPTNDNNDKEHFPAKQSKSKSTSDMSVREGRGSLTPYEHFAEYFKIYSAAQNAALGVLLSTKHTDWVRVKDPGEDSLEYIEINKKKTFLLKAVVDARPDGVSRVVFDQIDEVHLWSPKLTMHCTMLKRINENTHIAHSVITPGKVIKARDFVVLNHRTKMIVLGKESIVISSVSVDYDCPYLQSQPRSSLIRGTNGPSCMVISPLARERSEIKWILNGDLGGWEPRKIGDLALQAFLLRYMAALRERIIKLDGNI